MLIEKNVKDKRKSWYICDRCGKKLTGQSVYRVYAKEPKEISKKKVLDLCLPCYKIFLKRGVINEY